jgi:hypothetical protein
LEFISGLIGFLCRKNSGIKQEGCQAREHEIRREAAKRDS